ncbi:hypothetical protein [Rhodospirillum centenum]|uniref:Uncharacterized protein n=1 Tax=Rhodospirillum centenum (strain ATCC 51521 / SW) TaxID=414684 RepID=B6IT26_RHOCS|nr:hypothetical protein [Rhodospirillum centenum]ACI98784.1 hypothetical protein RC1_1380 [Rhodospirillum centenum SW]
MQYGLYSYDRRYRRRFWTRLLKVVLWLAALLVLATFSYQLGVEQLKSRQVSLREEIRELRDAKEAAERRSAQLQQIAQTAEIRANELEVRYQRDVPTGDLAKLSDLVAKKLAEGVDIGRLAFVIDQTGNPRSCSPPERRRFVLPTPIYKGANTSVAFSNGAVTVTGEGVSARSDSGQPESWFDPTKPVKLRFVEIGGHTTETTGLLPLQHSVVAGDKEYRFTITPGARSFVEVSGDVCPFP